MSDTLRVRDRDLARALHILWRAGDVGVPTRWCPPRTREIVEFGAAVRTIDPTTTHRIRVRLTALGVRIVETLIHWQGDPMQIRADQLRVGDLIDLEGDQFCDPEKGDHHESHKYELSQVVELQFETPQCLLLGIEGEGAYGVPPAHLVKVHDFVDARGEYLDGQHVNYPHEPGRLHDCPTCDRRCWCTTDLGTTQCVFEGEHQWAELRAASHG